MRYARRATGHTSEAYAVVKVWDRQILRNDRDEEVSYLENTPRNALEDFAGQQDVDVGSKERNEDEANHHEQGHDHNFLVPVAFENDAVYIQTYDFSARCSIGQSTFPCGTD